MSAPVVFFETRRLRVRAFSSDDVEAFVAYRAVQGATPGRDGRSRATPPRR